MNITEGNLTVDVPDVLFYLVEQSWGRARGANGQGHPAAPRLVGLRKGGIHGRIDRLVESGMSHVGGDTDDSHPQRWMGRSYPVDACANRVGAREKLFHELLVDDGREGLPLAVHGGEVSTCADGNLHDVKIVAHYGQGLHLRFCANRNGLPVDDYSMCDVNSAERNICHHGGLGARQGIEPREHFAAKLRLRRNLGVTSCRQLEMHSHYALRIEAGIDGAQVREAFDQQTCSHQEHQRESKFDCDQRLAQ